MKGFRALSYQLDGKLAVITLNRPQTRNALNQLLRYELADAISQAQSDEQVRVILLTGAGKAFCAGADLNESSSGSDEDGFHTQQLRNEYHPIINSIVEGKKPVVAVLNGATAGFGGAIALACDLLIMSEDAYIYSAFGAIGLVPDGGSHHWLLNALGSKKAYEMIAFSQRLDASQCLDIGIANRLAKPGALMADALQWAGELAEQAPLTLSRSKQLLRYARDHDLNSVMQSESEIQNEAARSEDFQEGMQAMIDKRKPQFKGR